MANKKFLNPINLVNLASDPGSASEGDIYYNTTADVVKVYANGAWLAIGAGGGSEITVSTTAPTSPTTGDAWYKNDTGEFYIYDGTYWVEVNGVVGLTQEQIQDYVAPLFTHANHTNASVTYEDASNELHIDVINAPSADYTAVLKHNVRLNGSIAKGQAVYVSSSNGTNMIVSKASNASEATSSKTIGLLESGGTNNALVKVVTEGLLAGLNTSTAGAEGDPVWLGTDGNLIYGLANKPYAPAHLVFIGVVTRKNSNNGEIFVKVQNGFELKEIHDIDLITNVPTEDQVLRYDDATGIWKNSGTFIVTAYNKTEATIAAFTPVYITTETIETEELCFAPADSSYSQYQTKLPAVGITTSTTANLSSTKIVTFGPVRGMTLTGYSNNDILYVASGGGLTNVKPTGNNAIQPFAIVTSVENGTIFVYGNSFYNHTSTLPNLASNKVWLGSTGRPVETTLDTSVVTENTNLYFTTERAQDATASLFSTGSHTGISVEYVDSSNLINLSNTGVTAVYGTTNEIAVSSSTGGVTIGIPDSPVFVTPNIGVATATSINGTTIPTSATLATTGDISSAVGDYIPLTQKGQDQGVAELDIDGFVPVEQLPDLSSTYSTTSHNHTLNSLSNVVITGTPSDGQAIVWDTTTSKWINETISGGASYPDQSGNNGKFLKTNGSTVSWDNVDLSGYQPLDQDLTDIAALTGNGFLKKTGGTWAMDSSTYLTSYTETDPVFVASEAYNITSTDTANWDNAYGWGNHSIAGYLTTETDPIFTASAAYNIISLDITNWNDSYSWGDHSLAGYLTEYLEETDPIFTASEAYYITSTDTSNWNDSYSWGDHALAGYLTSYSETSTLEDITDRGATSSNAITISNTTQSTTPTSGALIISGGVGIAKDVWIDGDLHVNGTTVTENTKTVSTHDNLIYLNAAQDSVVTNAVGNGTYVTYTADNDYTPGMDIRVTGMDPSGYNIASSDNKTIYSATSTQFVVAKTNTGTFVSGGTAHAKEEVNPDLGFAGGYYTYSDGYAHAGLFRDASDGVFKFFQGYTPEPDEAVNIDTDDASFELARISIKGITSLSSNYSIGIGYLSGNFSGNGNYAFGSETLSANSGEGNYGIGWLTLAYNIGHENYAIGTAALQNNTGNNNYAFGYLAGRDNTGSDNLFLGHEAGNQASLTNSGNYNVYIGKTYGLSTNNNILIADNEGNLRAQYLSADFGWTLGTIYSATWNGSAIDYQYGGTGLTTLGTRGSILRVNSGENGLEYTDSPTFSTVTTGTETPATSKTTKTFSVSSSPTTIATIPIGNGMVVAECVVLLSSTSDSSYHTSKMLVRGDLYSADLTEYAIIKDGTMDVTFTAVPSSTNILLKAATTNDGVEAHVISTYISAQNASI